MSGNLRLRFIVRGSAQLDPQKSRSCGQESRARFRIWFDGDLGTTSISPCGVMALEVSKKVFKEISVSVYRSHETHGENRKFYVSWVRHRLGGLYKKIREYGGLL